MRSRAVARALRALGVLLVAAVGAQAYTGFYISTLAHKTVICNGTDAVAQPPPDRTWYKIAGPSVASEGGTTHAVSTPTRADVILDTSTGSFLNIAYLTFHFCTLHMPMEAGNPVMPDGSYCFLSSNSSGATICPTGFQHGIRKIDMGDLFSWGECDYLSAGTPEYTRCQTLRRPRLISDWLYMAEYDWAYSTHVSMHFCCATNTALRDTAVSFDAVRRYLPSQFVLFQRGGACQKIAGRSFEAGTIRIAETSPFTGATSGTVPDGTYNQYYTLLNYCAYGESNLPYEVSSASQAHPKTSTQARITWATNSGATRYKVMVKGPSSTWQAAIDLTGTTYDVTGLSPSTTYTVTIYSAKAGTVYETVGRAVTFTTCPSGYESSSANPTGCPVVLCASCGPGTCIGPNLCSCPTGYAQPTCANCEPMYYKNNGNCVSCGCGPGATSCSSTGTCNCGTGWTSADKCSSCINGYFKSGNNCLACSAPCATCSGSSTTCTSCPAGSLLSGTTCVGNCTSTQFQSGNTCLACQAPCLGCTGLNTCTSCANSNQVLQGSTCVNNCYNGYYADANKVCQPCDTRCTTCSGPLASQCSACNTANGFVLNGTTCITTEECTASNRYVSGGQCLPCHSTCASCTGGAATQCTSCANPNHVRQGGACQEACNSGYAPNEGICIACPSPCATCSALATTSCTSCIANRYLSNNQCLEACPSNQYASGQVCQNCDSSCATCHGSGTSACTSCSVGFLSGGQCVEACPYGQFADSDGKCKPCTSPCASCSTSATACQSCNSPSLVLYNNACLNNCPGGFYNESAVCMQCPGECSACSSFTECSACNAPNLLSGSACISPAACNALPGYANGGTCATCDSSCASCTGPDADECTSCPSGKVLDEGVCVEACPVGKYADAQSVCRACIAPCATCTAGTSTSCTSCLFDLLLDDTACKLACPAGKYAAGGVCEPCHSDCATCTAGTSSSCTSCANTELVLDNGECTSFCSPGTYLPVGGDSCASCTSPCAYCSESATYCTRCTGGQRAYMGDCYTTCPDNTYPSADGFTCIKCDDSCDKCSGPGFSSCTSCKSGDYLSTDNRCLSDASCRAENGVPNGANCAPCHESCNKCNDPTASGCIACKNTTLALDDGQCLETCTPGKYADASLKCIPCVGNCANCTSATACTACVEGTFLYGSVCGPSCPDGYFADPVARACLPCAGEGCRVCQSTEQGDCEVCLSGFMFFEGACSTVCPDGSYSTTGSSCTACPAGCLRCALDDDGFVACSACTGSLLLTPAGQCRATCPEGHYASGGRCEPCDSACGGCSGPSSAQCTSCKIGSVLREGQCIAYSGCNGMDGHYVDGETGACLPCHTSCANCTGSATFCTACSGDGYLSGSSCIAAAACPAGTYADATTKTCEDCASRDCAKCTGPETEDCTACVAGRVLREDGLCATSCLPGTYADATGVCRPCHGTCATCDGGDPTDCIACNGTLVRNGELCAETCENGRVLQDGDCVPCQPPCFSCVGTPTFCTLCTPGQVATAEGRCVTDCPVGTYAYGGMCLPCARTCAACFGGSESNCTSCAPARTHVDNRCVCNPGTGEYANGTAGYEQGLCIVCPNGFTFDEVAGGCVATSAGGSVGDVAEDNTTSAIVGGAVGGVAFLVFVLMLVVFAMYRRRARTKRRQLEEVMDARGSLFMMSEMSESSRKLTLRTRQYMEEHAIDATVINTQIEVALPGFLRLDYDKDLRLETELGGGGTAVLYQAELLAPDLRKEHEVEQVAVKHIVPGPGMDELAHLMRFRQEVAIMWTLNFHPNIVRILGYTENPTCIITHLYETDLARYLYTPENDLPPSMALSIAVMVAKGLHAIHKSNCIHRDIKSANVLLRRLPEGGMHAAICDFGIARNMSAFSVVSTFVVNGLSARYAAPQVFAAMANGTVLDADTDRACDVYAFGVVMWEIVTRQAPWTGLSLEQIQEAVCAGERPPYSDLRDHPVLDLIARVGTACWHQEATMRPDMENVVRQFAG